MGDGLRLCDSSEEMLRMPFALSNSVIYPLAEVAFILEKLIGHDELDQAI